MSFQLSPSPLYNSTMITSYDPSCGKFVELLLRILCDPLPQTGVDVVYLFGQTPDNESSAIQRGLELLKAGLAPLLAIPSGQPVSGYPGFEAWHQKLVQSGIDSNRIIKLSVDHPHHQMTTLDEANSLIGFALKSDWQKIIIISPPFHQLRSFITSVSTALRSYKNLRIYNAVGESLDWLGTALHFQGKLIAKRTTLIHEEWQRLEKYHQKGDLVSLEEILEYLNQRDVY